MAVNWLLVLGLVGLATILLGLNSTPKSSQIENPTLDIPSIDPNSTDFRLYNTTKNPSDCPPNQKLPEPWRSTGVTACRAPHNTARLLDNFGDPIKWMFWIIVGLGLWLILRRKL